MFNIESGVEPPKGRVPMHYPFADMKPGDSFEVEGDVDAYNAVRSAAHRYGNRHGMTFSTRTVSGRAGDAVRCYPSTSGRSSTLSAARHRPAPKSLGRC